MNYAEISSFIEKHWNIIGCSEEFIVIFDKYKKNGKVSMATCGWNHTTVSFNPLVFLHRFLVNTSNYNKVSERFLKGSLLHEIGHSRCRDIVQLGTTVEREVLAQKWAIEYSFKNDLKDELNGLLELLDVWATIGKGTHYLAYEEIMSETEWARKYGLIT